MNPLIKEMKLSGNTYDIWGFSMGAFFAVASELYYRGLDIPSSWGYSPGLSGDSRELDTMESDLCLESNDSDLLNAGLILERFTDYLRTKGKDY